MTRGGGTGRETLTDPAAAYVVVTVRGGDEGIDSPIDVAAVAAGAGVEQDRWPVFSERAVGASRVETLLRLAEFSAGRTVLFHDVEPEVRLLLGPGADQSAPPAFAAAADLFLLALLVHPEWDDHAARSLLARCDLEDAVAGTPGLARSLAVVVAKLLSDLRDEADSAALKDLRDDLAAARSPLLELVRNIGPAAVPAARPADPLAGVARGEPADLLEEVADAELLRIFAPGESLSRVIPGYVTREAQVAMARAVAASLNAAQALLVEAGTGVGKSFAYLVPAALFAFRNNIPVVIATRTKNLQSQLYEKDLPVVKDALGLPFSAALVKGRRDYLCRGRLAALARAVGEDGDPDERLALAYFRRFERRVSDGDLERVSAALLERLPVLRRLVGELRTEHGARGRRCAFGRRCFYPAVARRASASHILVANHALALCWPRSFPPADVVVFDEAHDLVDTATDAFGLVVSGRQVSATLSRLVGQSRGSGLMPLARRAEREGGMLLDRVRLGLEDVAGDAARLRVALDDVRVAVERLLRERPADGDGTDGRIVRLVLGSSVRATEPYLDFAAAARRWNGSYRRLAGVISGLADDLEATGAARDGALAELWLELRATAERVDEAVAAVDVILAGDEEFVCWVEVDFGSRPFRPGWSLHAAPIDVGSAIHLRVLAPQRSTVLTSATLRVGGAFGFFEHHLGLDRLDPERIIEPLALGSPFDYESALRFFVPMGRENTLSRDVDVAARAIARIVFLAGVALCGRTLVLFNARARMRRVAELLRRPFARRGITLLCPGPDGGLARVLARFRAEPNAVLLGARAFWEGVDVPGSRILCAVMERIPFESPGDPVHAARTRLLEERGENGFGGYSLPRAVIRLLQGAGRLVRGEEDRGAVILLDPRVATNPRYGPVVRSSLPAACEIGPEVRVLDAVLDRLRADVVSQTPSSAELLAEAARELVAAEPDFT